MSDLLEAQYSVLGCALIWPEETVGQILLETQERDFDGPCLAVYRAIRALSAKGIPIDPVSINAELDGKYNDFLREVMEITITAANLTHMIQLCREQARVKLLRKHAMELGMAASLSDMSQVLQRMNALMVDKPGLKAVTMAEALSDFHSRMAKEPEYLTWPIWDLNSRLFVERGDFVVLGGYPSTGKSLWALQCARHLAKKYKVGFFSLETSSSKLFDRMISSMTDLTMESIKRRQASDKTWESVAITTSDILALQLELVPAAGLSPAEIRTYTASRGYEVVIIDYLQLLQGTGGNRAEQVASISMALHTMAQSMGVTVLALSQLKRKGDGDASPSMSDLRESGQIEQDADVVMLLKLAKESEPDGSRDLYVAKNKEGTCFRMRMDFDGQCQTFAKSAVRATETKTTLPPKKASRDDVAQMQMLPAGTWVPF